MLSRWPTSIRVWTSPSNKLFNKAVLQAFTIGRICQWMTREPEHCHQQGSKRRFVKLLVVVNLTASNVKQAIACGYFLGWKETPSCSQRLKRGFATWLLLKRRRLTKHCNIEKKLEAEVLRLTNPIGPHVDDLKKALGVEAQRVQTESISAAHLQIKDIIAAETTAFIARIRQLETLLKETPSQWKPDAETVATDQALRRAK